MLYEVFVRYDISNLPVKAALKIHSVLLMEFVHLWNSREIEFERDRKKPCYK